MSEPLYTLDILRLAAESGSIARLAEPDRSASQRSPLCGSSIILDLVINEGVITEIGGELRSCAFGQASAALFMRSAAGKTAREIRASREAIAVWLRNGDAPIPAWPGFEVLAPARAKHARHAAILLPFDAAVAALEADLTPA